MPRRAGRNYSGDEETQTGSVETASPGARAQSPRCVHGMPRSQCATCKAVADREQARVSDLFEWLLPFLQPPLGDNFDNFVAFPPGLTPYDFQREGIRRLGENEAFLLADEMGLGKSIQAIIALKFLFHAGRATTALIIAPKSVVSDWRHKLDEWAPELRTTAIQGSETVRDSQWSGLAHVYLVSYETHRNDAERLGDRRFDVCILDEAQRIKNPTASLSQAAVRRRNAKWRWALTGTPLENKEQDIVAIFEFLKPGCLSDDYSGRPKALREKIAPYVLRRRILDVLKDLPPKHVSIKWLDLTEAQRKRYDEVESGARAEMLSLVEQGIPLNRLRISALARLTELKKICNLDSGTFESCKRDFLVEELETIRELGEKALVFSQFPHETLEKIQPMLEAFEADIFHGGLSDRQRDAVLRRFKEDPESVALLMSVQAGGVGLTITEANHVFHFDLWWNPATAAQAAGRAYRIGQKKDVFETALLTVRTVEERVHQILHRKQALFDEVVEGLSEGDAVNALSEEELLSLFGVTKEREGATSRGRATGPGARDLSSLSPRQFEELVGNLYEKMRFTVRLGTGSRDAGIDIVAIRTQPGLRERVAIQCKHYPDGKVGRPDVQRLIGAADTREYTKRVLVTSGRFSREAEELARSHASVELITGALLQGLLDRYGLAGDLGGSEGQR